MGKTFISVAGVLLLFFDAQFAELQAGDDLRGLIEQLSDTDPASRLRAVESIALIADQAADAIPALTDLYLGDTDEKVRRRARTVIGQIKVARREQHALPPPAATRVGDGPLGSAPQPAASVTPEEPPRRIAELVKQLKADPVASAKASTELGRMGAEAKSACAALVEVMMQKDERWHDARLAATEALEKIHPKLQQMVLKITLKPVTEITPSILGFSELGPDGRGALPLLLYLWSLDWQLGLHEEGTLLQDLHAVAPTDKGVTDIVVRVVRGKETVGYNCYIIALEILSRRPVPVEELAEHYLGVLGNPEVESVFRLPGAGLRLDCLQRLRKMVTSKQVKPEKVVKPFINCLSDKHFELRKNALNALGEFGSAAKEAVPIIRRLKLEDPDDRIRSAAAAALIAIER